MNLVLIGNPHKCLEIFGDINFRESGIKLIHLHYDF